MIWDGKNEDKVMNFIFEWVNFDWVQSKGIKKSQWTSITAPVVDEVMTVTLKHEDNSSWGTPKPAPIIQTFHIPKGATITGVILDDGRRWISLN